EGCDGQVYPNPDTSKYRLPFETGLSYPMGLSNCSASYHSPGQPDQYAFDFDMPEGDKFRAARGGVVERVIEDRSSNGGGGGNFVSIDHEDGTFGLYLHSPQDGIFVEVGDRVKQGDVLGESGRSGLAGYPHLHFIVVKGSSAWPWDGMPISFRNAIPADIVLQSGRTYKACN
ncbi:MAG: M23 family metallopeptidase, partial [Bacteroidota bacterium]